MDITTSKVFGLTKIAYVAGLSEYYRSTKFELEQSKKLLSNSRVSPEEELNDVLREGLYLITLQLEYDSMLLSARLEAVREEYQNNPTPHGEYLLHTVRTMRDETQLKINKILMDISTVQGVN